MMVIMPFGGAFSIPITPAEEYETILYSEDGWTAESWSSVRNIGFEPLRLISPNELLVWGSKGERVGDAEWHAGIDVIEPDGDVRIILEPRLPHSAVSKILSTLNSYEIEYQPSPNSPLPMRILTEWYGIEPILQTPGILWVEPILETKARNEVAAGIMTEGLLNSTTAWEFGLNGSNVVIAYADTGIDRDHACFRNQTSSLGNATGIPSQEHRKIILLNESLDDWDDPSHSDGRHGTHIGGTLACSFVDGTNASEGTSLTYAAKLVVQDIVNESGWIPPDVDWLLWEGLTQGAVIHSDSWGDDTTQYTARTYDFDAWSSEVPWSVAFIAPGNNGGQMMEPANARSVVAVGVSTKSEEPGLYQWSSVGEAHDGRRGIHITTPGMGIVSAKADGIHDSMNNGTRSSTGSSMATPAAASFTVILQQLVEEGYFSNGTGFTPSGPLLRALLALAAEPIPNLVHNQGTTGLGPDNIQGWGRANLSRLVNFNNLSNSSVWIHDSYQMENWQQNVEDRVWAAEIDGKPLDRVIQSGWDGSGAMGPFIKTGESYSWNLSLTGEQIDVRLSWSPRPEPAQIDDLQLKLEFPDGKVAYGDDFDAFGNTNLHQNSQQMMPINETTVGIRLPVSMIGGFESVNLTVEGRFVNIGNQSDMLGVDGDKIGFSLAVKGLKNNILPEIPEIIDPFDGMEITPWSELNEYYWGSGNSVDGPYLASIPENWQSSFSDFSFNGWIHLSNYFNLSLVNFSAFRLNIDGNYSPEGFQFRLLNDSMWGDNNSSTVWVGNVSWGDGGEYNSSNYSIVPLFWEVESFYGNLSIDVIVEIENNSYWYAIPFSVNERERGDVLWFNISDSEQHYFAEGTFGGGSIEINASSSSGYHLIEYDPTKIYSFEIGYANIENNIVSSESLPFPLLVCNSNIDYSHLENATLINNSYSFNYTGHLKNVNFSSCYSGLNLNVILKEINLNILPNGVKEWFGGNKSGYDVNIIEVWPIEHRWFNESGNIENAPEGLTCYLESIDSFSGLVISSTECGPGNIHAHPMMSTPRLNLTWLEDEVEVSYVENGYSSDEFSYSLYELEDVGVEAFDWDGKTYLKWSNPLNLERSAWPVILRSSYGIEVKFLEQREEFELSKYCGEDVWIWWRKEMAYVGSDQIDTWVIEVGEHEMPESGFLPYQFNFSEKWVILEISETYLDYGDLNISVRLENLDNGMVIVFNFKSYGKSPYPTNQQTLESNVRCPAEELEFYSTTTAISVGGISAILLVISIAVWKRRRINDQIGVPEPFVGSSNLAGIVSPSEVDSSN
ncbi:S8 family serine peptidase [Deltaproteobacteria bacterium]|nr:S8 family serine peptidase [Deltaproteobacteria bacterium]